MNLTTDRLKILLELCKCNVNLSINKHRLFYESINDYMSSRDQQQVAEIEKEVYKKMIETDTIIDLCCYPATPIGFYQIYHYDLDLALDKAIGIITD